jgi:hypothetical protein
MIRTRSDISIGRPVGEVYDFVGVDFFANYPRWSPEVLQLEKLTAGPVRVGTVGRQVRRDEGRRTEARFRVSELTPAGRIAFVSLGRPHFRVCYDFRALEHTTHVIFAFELKPDPLLRPFRSVLQNALDRGSARVVRNIKALVEGEGVVGRASR